MLIGFATCSLTSIQVFRNNVLASCRFHMLRVRVAVEVFQRVHQDGFCPPLLFAVRPRTDERIFAELVYGIVDRQDTPILGCNGFL